MKINVIGHGVINFPSTMTEEEIRVVLSQFEPKQDKVIERLLTDLNKIVKRPIPKPEVIQVEKQVIIREPKVVEVERIVTVPAKPTSWMFTITNPDGKITEVLVEPIE